MKNVFFKQYHTHKEIIHYAIVGILTTLINTISYYFLVYDIFDPNSTVQLYCANIIAWILSVVFAFVSSKIWVFESLDFSLSVWWKEGKRFISCRLATGALDMLIMFIGISVCFFTPMYVKIFSNIIVIILNYVASKMFVF